MLMIRTSYWYCLPLVPSQYWLDNQFYSCAFHVCKASLVQVASQCQASETDQVQTISSGVDNIKQKAMSLLGQYLASKKVQITQTGVEVFSAPGMSNSSSSLTSTAAQGQVLSSSHVLPVIEYSPIKLLQYNGLVKLS